MKKYEMVRETVEHEKLVAQTCDICGEPASSWDSAEQFSATGVDYDGGNNRTAGADVELRMSASYPEGGVGGSWEVDVCPRCFVTKLIPFVESFGRAKITMLDTDW